MESEQFGDGSGARVPDFGPASLLLGESELSRVTLIRKRAQTSCVRRDVRTNNISRERELRMGRGG